MIWCQQALWNTMLMDTNQIKIYARIMHTVCALLCSVVVWHSPILSMFYILQQHHNERDSVSNHRRLDCLFNRLFRRKSQKTSKFPVTGLCEGKPPMTGDSPHKGLVMRKIPFDDVIMKDASLALQGCFTGIGVSLPKWYWNNPEEYGEMSNKRNAVMTKQNKNKAACIVGYAVYTWQA